MSGSRASTARSRAFVTVVTGALTMSLLVAVLASCGTDGSAHAKSTRTYRNVLLAGTATADAPVVGARVHVYDAAGHRAKTTGAITTDADGAFAATIARMPASYRVTVTGGRVNDTAFAGSLAAEGTSARDVETVSVNLVSTVVDAYRRTAPRASMDTAGLRVARFLGLPATNQPDALLDAPQSWFSADAFMHAADAGGGLDAFVRRVAHRAATSAHAHETFLPSTSSPALLAAAPSPSGSPATMPANPPAPITAGSIAKYVGGQLVNGAISYVGGAAFGWLLDKLGIVRSTASEFELVRSQLAVIQQQLGYISGQLDELMNLVGRVNLDVAVNNLSPVLDQIYATQDVMNKLLALDPADNGYTIKAERMKQAILDRTEQFLLPAWDTGKSNFPFGTTIPNGFFGIAGKTPIPQIIFENVARQGRFFTPAQSEAVQQLLGYYTLAYATQLQFVLEWEHVNSRSVQDTLAAYDSWTTKYATDKFTSTCALPGGTTLDKQTNLLWYTSTVPGEVPGAAYLNTAGNKGPGHVLPASSPPGVPLGTPWPPQSNPGCDAQKSLGSWRVATQEQVQKLLDKKPDGTSPADYLNDTAGFVNAGALGKTFVMTATHGDECGPCYVADWPYPTEDYRTLKTDTGNWTWCMPSWKDYGDDHKRLVQKGWKGCWTQGVAWLAVRPLADGEHYLS